MRRFMLAVPVATLLSLVVAGSVLATHCGVDNKPDGAGQRAIILVDPVSGAVTPLAGVNKAGKFVGGFIDVYLDFDGSGTVSDGDGKINDTFLISFHSGHAAPGQDAGGLPAIPAILDGTDPAGPDHGMGFADFTIVGS
jgi:hypothetical protein